MNMREIREAAGLRQCEVARKMQLTQTAISCWEVGKTVPNKYIRRKLASLYGCTVDELMAAVAQSKAEN